MFYVSYICWHMFSCSVVSNSAATRTVAHQVPLHRIFQTRILELVAFSSSRGSSWPEDQTCVSCISCIGSQNFYYQLHLRSPHISVDPLLIFFLAFSTFAFLHVQVRSLLNIFFNFANSPNCLYFLNLIINILQAQLMINYFLILSLLFPSSF